MSKQIIGILPLEQRATLTWLADAFGFGLTEVTPAEGDELQHAQLIYGDDVMMASTVSRWERTPGKLSTYLTVATDDDVDAAWARAVAVGAETLMEPEDQPYGGRNATVKDPEGNLWSIGSYHPDVG
jgi:uncharacterized glyoxalase superfamily protein PhnB